jgi:hypothetical protein
MLDTLYAPGIKGLRDLLLIPLARIRSRWADVVSQAPVTAPLQIRRQIGTDPIQATIDEIRGGPPSVQETSCSLHASRREVFHFSQTESVYLTSQSAFRHSRMTLSLTTAFSMPTYSSPLFRLSK